MIRGTRYNGSSLPHPARSNFLGCFVRLPLITSRKTILHVTIKVVVQTLFTKRQLFHISSGHHYRNNANAGPPALSFVFTTVGPIITTHLIIDIVSSISKPPNNIFLLLESIFSFSFFDILWKTAMALRLETVVLHSF